MQWVGLLAPKGMPPGAVEKLNTEINRAIQTPDMIAKFAQQGMSPAGGSPQKFQSVIVHEIKVWTEVARSAADIKSPGELGRSFVVISGTIAATHMGKAAREE